MANQNDTQNNLYPVLQEILRWTRINAIAIIGERVKTALTSDKEKLIYHFSDGENTSREIAAKINSNNFKGITEYWKKWARFGIVEPSPNRKGRWKKVIDLEEVGIDVPESPKFEETSPTAEMTTD